MYYVYRGIKNGSVDRRAFPFASEGQQRLVKLLDAVYSAACVVKDSSATSLGAVKERAYAVILNVKAVGLVVGKPLLLKCSAEYFY